MGVMEAFSINIPTFCYSWSLGHIFNLPSKTMLFRQLSRKTWIRISRWIFLIWIDMGNGEHWTEDGPTNVFPFVRSNHRQSEWAVLVSYYIPEMDNFAQFALVCMKQLPKDHDNDSMQFQFLKTYSLPYSYVSWTSRAHRRLFSSLLCLYLDTFCFETTPITPTIR